MIHVLWLFQLKNEEYYNLLLAISNTGINLWFLAFICKLVHIENNYMQNCRNARHQTKVLKSSVDFVEMSSNMLKEWLIRYESRHHLVFISKLNMIVSNLVWYLLDKVVFCKDVVINRIEMKKLIVQDYTIRVDTSFRFFFLFFF